MFAPIDVSFFVTFRNTTWNLFHTGTTQSTSASEIILLGASGREIQLPVLRNHRVVYTVPGAVPSSLRDEQSIQRGFPCDMRGIKGELWCITVWIMLFWGYDVLLCGLTWTHSTVKGCVCVMKQWKGISCPPGFVTMRVSNVASPTTLTYGRMYGNGCEGGCMHYLLSTHVSWCWLRIDVDGVVSCRQSHWCALPYWERREGWWAGVGRMSVYENECTRGYFEKVCMRGYAWKSATYLTRVTILRKAWGFVSTLSPSGIWAEP